MYRAHLCEVAMASSSSTSMRTVTVSSAKIDVEKFDGRNNFGLWQSEVLDGLCQQDLDIVLEERNKTRRYQGDRLGQA